MSLMVNLFRSETERINERPVPDDPPPSSKPLDSSWSVTMNDWHWWQDLVCGIKD